MSAPSPAAQVFPPDGELLPSIVSLRTSHPSLGIPKLLILLRQTHPTWSVSDKRFRKLLSSLAAAPAAPSSKDIPGLDVEKVGRGKVAVRWFEGGKGKGLVAARPLEQGEIVWTEEPWIYAPSWDVLAAQRSTTHCAHCTRLFPSPPPPLLTSCPRCPLKYCTRLCLTRALANGHAFLCAGHNPACAPLWQLAERERWHALMGVAAIWGRIIACEKEEEREWVVGCLDALAGLSQEERARRSGDWPTQAPALQSLWKSAHAALLQTYRPSGPPPPHLKKYLRQPLPALADSLLTYESFLLTLGMYSLNAESRGGVHALHSHLNHSCSPNLSVRHIMTSNKPGVPPDWTITLVAKRDVAPGEELCVSYVDPCLGVRERRERLGEWGFECGCGRCVEEGKEEGGKDKREGK